MYLAERGSEEIINFFAGKLKVPSREYQISARYLNTVRFET